MLRSGVKLCVRAMSVVAGGATVSYWPSPLGAEGDLPQPETSSLLKDLSLKGVVASVKESFQLNPPKPLVVVEGNGVFTGADGISDLRKVGDTPCRGFMVFGSVGAGKSSTLNALSGSSRFKVSHDPDPQTRNVEVSTFQVGDETLVAMDTEGFGTQGRTKDEELRLILPGLLASDTAIFVYEVSVRARMRDMYDDLKAFIAAAKQVNGGGAGLHLPHVAVVLGKCDSKNAAKLARRFFEEMPKDVEDELRMFPSVAVHVLPRFNADLGAKDPAYVQAVDELRKLLVSKERRKLLGRLPQTGSNVAHVIETVVDTLNKDPSIIIEPESVADQIYLAIATRAYLETMDSAFKTLDEAKDVLSEAEARDRVSALVDTAHGQFESACLQRDTPTSVAHKVWERNVARDKQRMLTVAIARATERWNWLIDIKAGDVAVDVTKELHTHYNTWFGTPREELEAACHGNAHRFAREKCMTLFENRPDLMKSEGEARVVAKARTAYEPAINYYSKSYFFRILYKRP